MNVVQTKRKWLPAFLLAGFLAILPSVLIADLLGAEIQYETKNDSVYIYLNTFEDYAYGRSAYINQYINIKSVNSSKGTQVKLNKHSKTDISPICESSCSNFTSAYCNNENTLVKTNYSAKVYLGEFGTNDCDLKIIWESYYRPKSFEKYFLEVTFNRCVEGGNKSPKIINDPYHIISLSEAYSYSWKAKDEDGDSLVYELKEARTDELNSINYEKGLSYKTPFNYYGQPQSSGKFPKGFHFDNQNGLLRFLPIKNSSNPVVVCVSEFRDGKKIGETIREIVMTVKSVNNKKPIVSGINGTNKEFATACANQELCFYIQAEDGDNGDEVEFTWETDIPNASISKKSGKKPTLEFCWTPSKSELRELSYFIKIQAKDNSCELIGKYERVINIKVVEPFDVNFAHHVSACKEITFSSETDFESPAKLVYEWQIGDDKYYGKDLTYNYQDGGVKKVNLVAINEASGCRDEFEKTISLPKSPEVSISGKKAVCPNSSLNLTAKGAKNYEWLNNQNAILADGQSFDFTIEETSTIIVKGTDKYGCLDFDTAIINVFTPEIDAFATEDLVCKGLPIIVKGQGATNYEWSINGLKENNNDFAIYSFTRNDVVEVKGTDQNGCTGSKLVSIFVDQDCVWPGDVNGDEYVNNKDVLYLGLSYNTFNTADDKELKSPVWQPYSTTNWNETFADNRNYKHADANNDGIIDFADLMVIDKFYNREILYTNKKDNNGYKLYFDYDVDSLKDKEVIEVTISLGTEDEPAKDVYGIAFTIDYNNVVDSGSISFNTENSWLAEGSNTIKLVKNIPNKSSTGGGKIDIAYCRTSKKPKSGSGKVGSVKFVVQDDIDWKKLHFIELMLEGIEIIDENGESIDAYGQNTSIQLSDLYSSVYSSPILSGINIYPNPATNGALYLNIDDSHESVLVSIYSVDGKKVIPSSNFKTGVHQIELNEVENGYYFVVCESSKGKYTVPVVVK